MKSNSLLAALFRAVFYLLALFILFMLFWSTELIQEDLKSVQGKLKEIENKLSKAESHASTFIKQEKKNAPSVPKVVIDESKNLLKDDPFLEGPIQKMLGNEFQPVGILETGTFGKPEHLHPFSPWAQVSSWQGRCTPTLGRSFIGRYEPFAKNGAISMEESAAEGEVIYTIRLRDDIFWEPLKPEFFPDGFELAEHFLKRHPVTAEDYRFNIEATLNDHVSQGGAIAMRAYLQGLIGIEAVDDTTLKVRWKAKKIDGQWRTKYDAKYVTASFSPLASFVYKYYKDGTKILEDDSDPHAYRDNPAFGEQFSEHWAKQIIVSSGPWVFNGLRDSTVRFQRNPSFYTPYQALVAGEEIAFLDSADSLWNAFKAGLVDLHSVAPDQLKQLDQFLNSSFYKEQEKKGAAVRQLSYLTRAYTYLGWNQNKPWFQNKNVRRALTMSIDRARLIKEVLRGLGTETHGTFHPLSEDNDPSIKPLPYDPDEAKKILQEEGWVDKDHDGIREKLIDGKNQPFRFQLNYYVKNPTSKQIVEFVATALKGVGIECIPQGLDMADFSAQMEDRQFDSILLAWALGTPPSNPRQLWHSEGAKQKGSSNLIGFNNKKADAIIEALEYESDPKKRKELYFQFDAILHEEQPYTFLYVPKSLFLYREYVKNVYIPKDHPELFTKPDVLEPLSELITLGKKPL